MMWFWSVIRWTKKFLTRPMLIFHIFFLKHVNIVAGWIMVLSLTYILYFRFFFFLLGAKQFYLLIGFGCLVCWLFVSFHTRFHDQRERNKQQTKTKHTHAPIAAGHKRHGEAKRQRIKCKQNMDKQWQRTNKLSITFRKCFSWNAVMVPCRKQHHAILREIMTAAPQTNDGRCAYVMACQHRINTLLLLFLRCLFSLAFLCAFCFVFFLQQNHLADAQFSRCFLFFLKKRSKTMSFLYSFIIILLLIYMQNSGVDSTSTKWWNYHAFCFRSKKKTIFVLSIFILRLQSMYWSEYFLTYLRMKMPLNVSIHSIYHLLISSYSFRSIFLRLSSLTFHSFPFKFT